MIGPRLYRLQWRRRMERRYRAVAIGIALAAVLAAIVPAGISTETTPIVTGHSSFYNGDDFDPCLAAIVGIMRLRVMWFNHEVLVERYNGDGAYIYATEHGAPSPTADGAHLVSSGVFYDFVDPNGVAWHVDEAYWDSQINTVPADVTIDNDDLVPDVDVSPKPLSAKRWYTWIVAVDKPVRDHHAGSDPHEWYNFVVLLNTCKFRKDNLNNSQPNGNLTHPAGMGPDTGHLKNDPAHEHERYEVSLWVGTQPKIAPVGTETPYQIASRAGVGLDVVSDPTAGDQFNDP